MKHVQILTNLRKIIRAVNLEGKRIEKEYGLSIPQLLCLTFLNEQTGFMSSHKAIKEYLQLNASTVTGIISRLEKKGCVARLPKQNDKRIALVALTAKGAALLDRTPAPYHELLTKKLSELPDQNLQNLQNAFKVIIDFLDIESVDASPIVTSGLVIDHPHQE